MSFETRWIVPRYTTPSLIVYSAPDHVAGEVFLSGFVSGQCVLVLPGMQFRSRQTLLLDTVAHQVAAQSIHSRMVQLTIAGCSVLVARFSGALQMTLCNLCAYV